MSFINTHRLISYLTYVYKAETVNSVHSPFIYALLMECFENKKEYYAYSEIDRIKYQLAVDQTKFSMHDFGSLQGANKSSEQTISEILKTTVLGKKQGQFFYNLSRLLSPKWGLELGTSLGIPALYLCHGNPDLTLHSILSHETFHQTATSILKQFKLKPNLHVGNNSEILQDLLTRLDSIDLVHIDVRQAYPFTKDILKLIKPYLSDHAVMIYSNIYSSSATSALWKDFLKDEDFQISIDLFHLGLIIKQPEMQTKQHVTIIERIKKPWRLGFWA